MHRYRVIVMLAILLSVLIGPGCISDREPFVLLLDDSYVVRLLATGRDGLVAPDGIAVASERVLYIADRDGVLLKWSEGGIERLSGSSSGLASPESMVCAGDGTLYITDDSAGGVWRLDAGGGPSPLACPGPELRSTEGIAIAPDGSLLVGDGMRGSIIRVTRAGGVSVFSPPGGRIEKAEAMVFDEDGNLYVADDIQRQIFIVEPGREPRVLLGAPDGIGTPEALAYHAGQLFIADGGGRIDRWSRARRELDTIAIFHGDLQYVQNMAASGRGALYVTVACPNPASGYLFELEPAGGR